MNILLFGAQGQLGLTLTHVLAHTHTLLTPSSRDCSLEDKHQLQDYLTRVKPELIINAAAFNHVDLAETQVERCLAINGFAVEVMALYGKQHGCPIVHFSSDYVFSGNQTIPYTEQDPPCPINAYGRSKHYAEQALTGIHKDLSYIIRTSWLYSPYRHNFVKTLLRLSQEQTHLNMVANQWGTPTYTDQLLEGCLTLVSHLSDPKQVNDLTGIYHLANSHVCSWFEFAQAIIRCASQYDHSWPLRTEHILPIGAQAYPRAARRPTFSALNSDHTRQLLKLPKHNLDTDLTHCIKKIFSFNNP